MIGKSAAIGVALAWVVATVSAAPEAFNYDEAKVRPYSLPDPLRLEDGTVVRTKDEFQSLRRPELLRLFQQNVYGKTPSANDRLSVSAKETRRFDDALRGAAIMKEVVISFTRDPEGPAMTLLLLVPKTGSPAPVFLGLNFSGNHGVVSDPRVTLNTNWIRNRPELGLRNHRSNDRMRGKEEPRWQPDLLIQRGYALATVYYGDIDPDYGDNDPERRDCWQNGIHPLFYQKGQTKPADDEWGAIGAWAWGLSRCLDYLGAEPLVDARRVAVIGHSRLGKTALWAGAQDERFAMVISNNSGCGGAALSKRNYGETVERINTAFPHWFCRRFSQYNAKEESLPVDQHELIALVAPRPVYVASATLDGWADPRGEFLAAYHADPVYRLFGLEGLGLRTDLMPGADQPIQHGLIGYHLRTGKHDVTRYDWEQYLRFADRHLKPPAEATKRN